MFVKPKKYLGQHFLKDENIARVIVNILSSIGRYNDVLEIGPGMGVLTKYLLQNKNYRTFVIDIDKESIDYLKLNYPQLNNRIIEGDFLKMNFQHYFDKPFAIIGNFPYNISSQILFKILENRDLIPEVVGMFQKEVAERVASKPKNKSYGILSVLMQTFYDIEYVSTIDENVFIPPPKVKSAVIRCTRNNTVHLKCSETFFFKVVKTGFNQRRKKLRNALHNLLPAQKENILFLDHRAEELSFKDFEELTLNIEKALKV